MLYKRKIAFLKRLDVIYPVIVKLIQMEQQRGIFPIRVVKADFLKAVKRLLRKAVKRRLKGCYT